MTVPLHPVDQPPETTLRAPMVSFDIRHIPFSMTGSWLNLSPVVALHTTADDIHLISHVNGMHPVMRLQPELDGAVVDTDWSTSAAVHAWRADDGSHIEAVFEQPHVIRLHGSGLSMRLSEPLGELTPFSGSYLFQDPVDGAAVLTSYETGRRYRVHMIRGAMTCVGAEELGGSERSVLLGDGHLPWEAVIVETTSSGRQVVATPTFEEVVYARAEQFADYAALLVGDDEQRAPAATLAAYTLWSATVAPAGMTTRPSILMSKHWMDKLWSWDHCFNAIALAPAFPDLAIDQFLAPFDHQDPDGALPDSVTHSEVLYNYVKPPIHGWALSVLRETLPRPMTRAELELVHDRLSRWSEFWLTQRRVPGHDLPHYQHGNDSGWDNSTAFDVDRVVEAPDLAAFLSVQLEVLAGLSRELGRDAERWQRESDRLVAALLEQLWTPHGFVAVGAASGLRSETTSLLSLLPLLLGPRLPADVRHCMVERVRLHLTEHGLATEQPRSRHYQDDGYWRGPIWAPATSLIIAGLRRSGEPALAREIARRFAALCERSGFAENFDAISGAGLRDRAYTWTASVYLTLTRSL